MDNDVVLMIQKYWKMIEMPNRPLGFSEKKQKYLGFIFLSLVM